MNLHSSRGKARVWLSKAPLSCVIAGLAAALLALGLSSCSMGRSVSAEANDQQGFTAGVVNVVKKTLSRELTLSSELVPFQEIDVYAKESGYVKTLNVDYGTHVRAGEVMALLEIPELEAQLQEDRAITSKRTM
jgi:membrane fusion protein (multidrug efflux system)